MVFPNRLVQRSSSSTDSKQAEAGLAGKLWPLGVFPGARAGSRSPGGLIWSGRGGCFWLAKNKGWGGSVRGCGVRMAGQGDCEPGRGCRRHDAAKRDAVRVYEYDIMYGHGRGIRAAGLNLGEAMGHGGYVRRQTDW